MHTTLRTITTAFFLFQAILVNAATKTPAATPAPMPKLNLESSTNKVEFLVTGDLGGISVPGKVSEDYKGKPLTGELTLNKNQVSGTAIYDLTSLTTGISLRDNHMKNKYLEVEKYPKAKLTLDPISLPADQKVGSTEKIPFKGNMEVKGQTKPVTGTLAATKTADGHDLRFTWDLKLTDFGIQTPSFMDVTLTEKVNLDVNVQGKFQ